MTSVYSNIRCNCAQLQMTPWTVAQQTPLPWYFPGKNPGVGCHILLQGISLTQGSNLCLLYWQADSYPLCTWEALPYPTETKSKLSLVFCKMGGSWWRGLKERGTLKKGMANHFSILALRTPWIAACQASLSITNSRSSLRFTSIESVMPSSHLILCRPLLLLPPIPPSIRVFSNESTFRMRWPKYWSFSLALFLPKKSQGWSPFRSTL